MFYLRRSTLRPRNRGHQPAAGSKRLLNLSDLSLSFIFFFSLEYINFYIKINASREFFNHKDHKKRCRYEISMYKNSDTAVFLLCASNGARLYPKKSFTVFVSVWSTVRDTKVKSSSSFLSPDTTVVWIRRSLAGTSGDPEEPRSVSFALSHTPLLPSFSGFSVQAKLLTPRRIDYSLSKMKAQPVCEPTVSSATGVCYACNLPCERVCVCVRCVYLTYLYVMLASFLGCGKNGNNVTQVGARLAATSSRFCFLPWPLRRPITRETLHQLRRSGLKVFKQVTFSLNYLV